MKVTIIVEHAGYGSRHSLVSESLSLPTLEAAYEQARASLSRHIETLYPHPVIVDGGLTRIRVIKVIREHTGMGLKEAKEATEGLPKKVPAIIPEKLKAFVAALREAGATVSG